MNFTKGTRLNCSEVVNGSTFYIYKLISVKNGRSYIGLTNNIVNRMAQHFAGQGLRVNGRAISNRKKWDIEILEVINIPETISKKERKQFLHQKEFDHMDLEIRKYGRKNLLNGVVKGHKRLNLK